MEDGTVKIARIGMTEQVKKREKHPAQGARIIATGLAVSSTLGMTTTYAIRAQIKYIESVTSANAALVAAPVATEVPVAPSAPSAAAPVARNRGKQVVQPQSAQIYPSTQVTVGTDVPQTPVTAPQGAPSTVQAPVAPSQPVATNPPAVTNPPVATNPPVVVVPVPTTAPKTSSSK
jgi:hypothetical protein